MATCTTTTSATTLLELLRAEINAALTTIIASFHAAQSLFDYGVRSSRL
jgi:predicted component of type VI protein secretion system